MFSRRSKGQTPPQVPVPPEGSEPVEAKMALPEALHLRALDVAQAMNAGADAEQRAVLVAVIATQLALEINRALHELGLGHVEHATQALARAGLFEQVIHDQVVPNAGGGRQALALSGIRLEAWRTPDGDVWLRGVKRR